MSTRSAEATDDDTRSTPSTRRRRVIRLNPKEERTGLFVLIGLAVAAAVGAILYIVIRKYQQQKAAEKEAAEKSRQSWLPSQEELDKMTDEEKAALIQAEQERRERKHNDTLSLNAATGGSSTLSTPRATGASAAQLMASTGGEATGEPIKEFVRKPSDIIRQKLLDLCPEPNQILEVGTSGVYHCYKPCPSGFEPIIIDPTSEHEEPFLISLEDGSISTPRDSEGGVVKPQPYQACRAKCPPGTDASGTSGNACTRTFLPMSDRQGRGPDIVKCPWAPGEDIYVVKSHSAYPRRTNEGQDCNDTVLGNAKSYECAKGRLDTTWVGGKLDSAWCSHWSKRAVKKDSEREYGAWSAAACGQDYELLPTGPDAYFDRDIKGNVWHFAGSNKPPSVYMGCFKMCPANTEAVPGGPLEASAGYCAEQCPINTRVDPTKPQHCVKDGFEREIILTDMQRIRDLT